MPEALSWILFALASVAAALGLIQWRSASGSLARERGAHAASSKELKTLRDELAKRERRRDDQGAELRDLRKRLEKTKRRAFEGQAEVEPLQARVALLEAQLDGKEKTLVERAVALARAEALAAQTAAARDDALATARRAEAEATTETAQQADASQAELAALKKERAGLSRRANDAERETTRYRQRWRTQQRLYMVIRGELEIAKDRIRELEGRPAREKPFAPPEIPESADLQREIAAADAELGELN